MHQYFLGSPPCYLKCRRQRRNHSAFNQTKLLRTSNAKIRINPSGSALIIFCSFFSFSSRIAARLVTWRAGAAGGRRSLGLAWRAVTTSGLPQHGGPGADTQADAAAWRTCRAPSPSRSRLVPPPTPYFYVQNEPNAPVTSTASSSPGGLAHGLFVALAWQNLKMTWK